MKIAAIVAVDEADGIGRKGGLLCHMPADLKHFKSVTMGYPIIMGRKTFESFPKGPLPGRLNIILTRDASYAATGAVVCHEIAEAISIAEAEGRERCFVIGGGQIYAAFAGYLDELYLTRIHARFDNADTFFPMADDGEWDIIKKEDYAADERNPFPYSFLYLKRSR